MKKSTIIINAIKALGYATGKLHIEYGNGNAVVSLNGSYFGIYNFERNTFVD